MSDAVARLISALERDSSESSDFDLNPDVVLPPDRSLRAAGVLVPIDISSGAAQVILTKRAGHLKHHPGQIAFPGGKQDESDADLNATALREAREEIGLPTTMVELLGHLPRHETVTGFSVTPVVGVIRDGFEIVPEPGEVSEVFRVPLAHLANPAYFSVQSRRWRGQQRHYYTVPHGPYYIWGATARILRGLAERLAQ